MELGKSIAIFEQIESDKYTDIDKIISMSDVTKMATHNSIKKQTVINALKWFLESESGTELEEIEKLQSENDRLKAENEQLKELLRLAVEDINKACTYSPCNNGVCKSTNCKGNIIPCNFKWQHADRMEKLMGGRENEM